jgi:hypothetical protein
VKLHIASVQLHKKIDAVRIFSCYCRTEIHQTHLSIILREILKACISELFETDKKTSDSYVASKLKERLRTEKIGI